MLFNAAASRALNGFPIPEVLVWALATIVALWRPSPTID
jgi:hypothetical protein